MGETPKNEVSLLGFVSLGVDSASMRTPRISACATAHNGKRVVVSLFMTYPFPLLSVKAGTCTLRGCVVQTFSWAEGQESKEQPQSFEGCDDPVRFSVSLESPGCVVWSDPHSKPWRLPGRCQASFVGVACPSTRHACDQLDLDRPHSQWRLCEIFLRRYSRVTSTYSGRGFTLFGACLAAKTHRDAKKGRS